jgi:acyl-CoA thioesterase FadM
MGKGIEAFRAAVHAWECDAVEHFTTAYYLHKIGSSAMRMLIELGYAEDDPFIPTTQYFFGNFSNELHKGDVYHIEAGVVEASESELVLGHRVIDSDSEALCASFLQRLDGRAKVDIGQYRIDWNGPHPEERPVVPDDAQWTPTSAFVVRPEELDWSERLDLGAYINHMSAANIQTQTLIGMSPSYMREQRFGFSTFEYQFRLLGTPPRLADVLETSSAVAHVGRTSLRFVHRMCNASTGEPVAILSQMGVHLDLDTRRPAPLPEPLATKARRLLAL